MYRIEAEGPGDGDEVEVLYDLAFGPGRTGLSSYRLRAGVAPVADLARVARDADGILSGAIRVWPVAIAGVPALLLGPIAVHPTRQGEGLGGLLIAACIEAAAAAGWQRAMLVGDAPYYGRFGFKRLDGVEMPPPTNPDRVLGLALCPGGWTGITGPVNRAVPDQSERVSAAITAPRTD